jgi:hypothetical protein
MGNGNELEALLRPPTLEMPPYPPKVITLASGESMVVRQIDREEVPILLEAIYPLLWVERDYERRHACSARCLPTNAIELRMSTFLSA